MLMQTYLDVVHNLQVVMGKTMEDWCRFSVCFWHTFRGTGLTILLICLKYI